MAWGRGPGAPSLHALLLQIEDCSKPVVMAIHGTVLGGSDYPLIVKENAIKQLQLNEKRA